MFDLLRKALLPTTNLSSPPTALTFIRISIRASDTFTCHNHTRPSLIPSFLTRPNNPISTPSTIMIRHQNNHPSPPLNGVHLITLPFPLSLSSPILLLSPTLRRGIQVTLAVTATPSLSAVSNSSIVCFGPPSLEKRWARSIPGMRRVGETNVICSEG